MNKTFVYLVGDVISLPFIVLETMIKIIMLVGYFPTALILAVIYPLIKDKNLEWINKWYNYSTTWRHGFYTAGIHKMWKD